jgi:hypothetical protein
MSTTKTLGGPVNHVRLGCKTCQRYHDAQIPCDDPTRLLRELESWEYKHSGHDMPFPVFLKREMPRDFDDAEFDALGKGPWWHPSSGFRENTNFQTTFLASAALTLTSWATLASDSSLLAGASTAVVDNGASGAPLEIGVTCRIKNGTTPTTGKEIDVYAWCMQDDSTYPDAITGSDAAITMTGTDAVNNALGPPLWSFASTTTTGASYPTGWHTGKMVALGASFGLLPRYWGLWIVHNTVAAFASGSTAAQKGIYVAG